MNGKGDKRRPEDRAKIEANWDRIFGKKEDKLSGMWTHMCEEQNSLVAIASGEYCSFCARGEGQS